MKQTASCISLALLVASTHGQISTVVNDPSDTTATTIYYSVCPTAVSMTITLSSTMTYCPGPNCHGGPGPAITPALGAGAPNSAVPSGLGTEIIDYTTVGPDGSTTHYQEFMTVYSQLDPTGGLQPQTFTVTEVCPCEATRTAGYLPSGFSTTVYECDVCEITGGPRTVTLTTPCSTGPYAMQTSSWTSWGAPWTLASGSWTGAPGGTATGAMPTETTGTMPTSGSAGAREGESEGSAESTTMPLATGSWVAGTTMTEPPMSSSMTTGPSGLISSYSGATSHKNGVTLSALLTVVAVMFAWL